MFQNRSTKLFAIVLIVLVFATTAFAFAASNTVPASYAGEGASVTSGYTVTSVAYNLNATTPSNIDNVTFTLNAAAGTVKIRLVTTGSYYACTNTGGNNWSCTTAGVTVAAADEFRVVASQ
jgi:archaellin